MNPFYLLANSVILHYHTEHARVKFLYINISLTWWCSYSCFDFGYLIENDLYNRYYWLYRLRHDEYSLIEKLRFVVLLLKSAELLNIKHYLRDNQASCLCFALAVSNMSFITFHVSVLLTLLGVSRKFGLSCTHQVSIQSFNCLLLIYSGMGGGVEVS